MLFTLYNVHVYVFSDYRNLLEKKLCAYASTSRFIIYQIIFIGRKIVLNSLKSRKRDLLDNLAIIASL